MKNSPTTIWIAATLLSLRAATFAAPALSWKDAMLEASAANPALASSRLALKAAQSAVTIATAGYFPSLGLNAGLSRDGHSPLLNGIAGPESDSSSYQAGLSANWNIFNGFATEAARQSSLESLALRKAAYDQASASLLLSLKGAFMQLLFDQKNADLLQAIWSRYAQDMKYQELQYKSGHAARWTFLKAQSDEAETKWQVEQNRLNTAADLAALAVLLGRDPSASQALVIEGEIPVAEPPLDDAAGWTEALSRHHSLAQERAQLRSSQAALWQAEASRYPSLGASGGYGYSGADSWGPDQSAWQASLNLNFNLFSGGSAEASINQARDSAQAAEEDLKGLLFQLKSALDKAWASYSSAYGRLPVTHLAAEAGKDRFETVHKLYESGLAAFLDYEQAESTYTQSQQAELSSILSAALAQAQYESALGRTLEDAEALK